jgi:hypothetical protein
MVLRDPTLDLPTRLNPAIFFFVKFVCFFFFKKKTGSQRQKSRNKKQINIEIKIKRNFIELNILNCKCLFVWSNNIVDFFVVGFCNNKKKKTKQYNQYTKIINNH